MNPVRGLLTATCILSLSACSMFTQHSELEALNNAQPAGSPFTQHLTAEYRSFANNEMEEMMDYPDSIHFARKGIAAAQGEVVMPEPVSDWDLTPAHMDELSTARARLVNALDRGARQIAPKQSAIAQGRFDCWIEYQEENWGDSGPSQCKTMFYQALEHLEGLIGDQAEPDSEFLPPIESVAPPSTAEPMKPEEAMYLVFFDFDSSKIGSGGNNVLDAIAEEVINREQMNGLTIIGHTDSSGPKSYNEQLATRRASAVKDALVKRGIDASMITVESRGENELLVQTADGVREPANRRTQITFR